MEKIFRNTRKRKNTAQRHAQRETYDRLRRVNKISKYHGVWRCELRWLPLKSKNMRSELLHQQKRTANKRFEEMKTIQCLSRIGILNVVLFVLPSRQPPPTRTMNNVRIYDTKRVRVTARGVHLRIPKLKLFYCFSMYENVERVFV